MRFLYAYLFILSFFVSHRVLSQESCHWSPQYLHSEATYAVIEIENSPTLWSTVVPDSKAVEVFHDEINKFTNTDQSYLRERQFKIFQKHFKETEPSIQMMKLIMSGTLGKTVKVRCLELLLLDLHLRRVGKNYYSEYGAHIFIKNDKIRLLYKSSDDASVATGDLQKQNIKEAVQEGYKLKAHLHLHPFNLDNPQGDIGGVAWPSGPGESYGDMNVYVTAHQEYKLQEAWVTNGFDTIILKPNEFTLLRNLKKSE